jgi:HAMP domain-containing protein
MSSPFFSELTKLDVSLRVIQAQVDRLRSGLDDDPDQLKQNITEACGHASALRDLIHKENANPKWSDREALEHLILALEIAADENRVEQRRGKLLDLAAELEAGSIKHRSNARAESLNALRMKAAAQLRELAARKEQDRELPGPEASQWVHWVCNLEEEKDAAVLAELRENYTALDELAASIEESFWVPGQRTAISPPAAAATIPELPSVPRAESPAASATQTPPASETESPAIPVAKPQAPGRVSVARLPKEVKAHFDKAVHTGDFSEALLLCYDAQESEAASPSEAQTPGQPPAVAASKEVASATGTASPPLKYCEECGRTYPSRYKVCPFDSMALKDLPESAPETPEIAGLPDRYKISQPAQKKAASSDRTPDVAEPKVNSSAPVVQSVEAETILRAESFPADEGAASASASFATFDEVGSRKKPITLWLAVAAVVVLCAIIAWTYFQPSHNKRSDAQMRVAQAAVNADVPKPLLHLQPAEGAQNNILLSMENCERANATGIQCWGYISNQRDKDSKISLYRVNAIDGKGNSFDLSSKGQATFADVHDFTVPAQSKVKYSIKVPDNDKDARTLTLYLDVANPRGSEYTFRNVPVSD